MLSLQHFVLLIAVAICCFTLLLVASTSSTNATPLQQQQNSDKVFQALIKRHLANKHKNNKNEKVGDPQFYPACGAVTSLGYPCENHEIMTEDGFVLGAIRIPPSQSGAYPVFLQHGLIDASSTWTMNANGYQNLGCILHDQGYDVWIGNSRGNHYSFTNVNYPAQDSQQYFRMIDWDFMAKYDVPANIGYVLNKTGKSSLGFVGHSQGTTQMFAAMVSSETKHLASKIDVFIALAPVAFVKNSPSLLLRFIASLDVGSLLQLLGEKFFLTDDALLDLVSRVCPDLGDLCQDILMPIVGTFTASNINASQLHNVLRYTPGGTSVNNMIHWQQSVDNTNQCGFCGHDYGSEINQQIWNSTSPPVYNLSAYAGPPVVLFTGPNDDLADPKDVELLIAGLQNSGAIVGIFPIPSYAHMDFVWGINANRDVYKTVVDSIQKYQRN